MVTLGVATARRLKHRLVRLGREMNRPFSAAAALRGSARSRPQLAAAVLQALLRGTAVPAHVLALDPAEPRRRIETILPWAKLAAAIRRGEPGRSLHECLTASDPATPGVASALAFTTLAGLADQAARQRLLARLPATLLHHHLGLGDHLICNGMVRHLAARTPTLGLLVKTRYLESVHFMYRDLAGLVLLAVEDDREATALIDAFPEIPALRIGFERLDTRRHSFAEDFYRQAGLPYEVRWSGRFERDPRREAWLFDLLVPAGGPYVFLHDDPTRGFVIDRRRVRRDLAIVEPRPGLTDNIFDYCRVLERATEVHCMDSAFRNLVDDLDDVRGQLFLHTYVRPADAPSRKRWSRLA